MESVRS